jgi:hypothetical protein
MLTPVNAECRMPNAESANDEWDNRESISALSRLRHLRSFDIRQFGH